MQRVPTMMDRLSVIVILISMAMDSLVVVSFSFNKFLLHLV